MLRASGLPVTPSSTVAYVSALGVLDLGRVEHIYWAGRACLVPRSEDVPRYDSAFEHFFFGVEPTPERLITSAEVNWGFDNEPPEGESADDLTVDEPAEQEAASVVRFSSVETLRDRDFAQCSEAERDELGRAIDRLRWQPGAQSSRRFVSSRRAAGRVDLRRTVAAAMRTEGELLTRRHRHRAVRQRRLVLLLDVSGSMEPYARAIVRFAHAAVMARHRVEVFSLGTRLTRITRELSPRDADLALGQVATSVVDWAGGTRLGEGLGSFCDEWGQRGMARGAVVVIVSDGWDRGDPDELAEQMARLGRLAKSIIWVNPLRGSEGYEPLARGMAAALPHCDRFVDGHSLASLEALAVAVVDESGHP